jgi:hypothetical protein
MSPTGLLVENGMQKCLKLLHRIVVKIGVKVKIIIIIIIIIIIRK